jgi:hypothetical protein
MKVWEKPIKWIWVLDLWDNVHGEETTMLWHLLHNAHRFWRMPSIFVAKSFIGRNHKSNNQNFCNTFSHANYNLKNCILHKRLYERMSRDLTTHSFGKTQKDLISRMHFWVRHTMASFLMTGARGNSDKKCKKVYKIHNKIMWNKVKSNTSLEASNQVFYVHIRPYEVHRKQRCI